MKYGPFAFPCFMLLSVVLSLSAPIAGAADDGCGGSGQYGFVCGPKNPEDLVRVPGSKWIIASSMAVGTGIYLIDSGRKTWSGLYPGNAARVQQDTKLYASCPGAPDASKVVTHGLNLRPRQHGHSTLYVVAHGGRESIEVFDVDATGEAPVLTWQGCILTPGGMQANSVASSSDGSLLVTIPLRTGIPMSDAMAGKSTGGVYKWSPGDAGFAPVAGTDLPFPNGIETSADGKEFFVASSGQFTVSAYSNTNPARLLRQTGILSFLPDNVHRQSDGRLLTAGLDLIDQVCGTISHSSEFTFEKFATCPRPYTILAIDPRSMKTKVVATGPANVHFSNVTMALPVDGELWIGSFGADRVAYISGNDGAAH